MEQDGSYPRARPGVDFAADAAGRPADARLRLLALSAMLSTRGLSSSPGNLHALAFWEEALSGVLGCAVRTLGFRRTPDGPRSGEVETIVAGWQADGTLLRDPSTPDLDPALHTDHAGFAAGIAARGDEPGSQWWRALDGFVWGMASGEPGEPRVSRHDDSGDVRRLSLCDPIYEDRGWEDGGPAAVAIDMGALAPELAGLTGSVLATVVAAMALHRREAGDVVPPPYEAGQPYAGYLRGRAASLDPRFGEGHLPALRDAIEVRDGFGPNGTATAAFFRDGEPVGNLVYEPGGRIIDITVAEGSRRAGLGTLALRLAMADGARSTVPAPAGSEAFLGRHGRRLDDGSYALSVLDGPAPGSDR